MLLPYQWRWEPLDSALLSEITGCIQNSMRTECLEQAHDFIPISWTKLESTVFQVAGICNIDCLNLLICADFGAKYVKYYFSRGNISHIWHQNQHNSFLVQIKILNIIINTRHLKCCTNGHKVISFCYSTQSVHSFEYNQWRCYYERVIPVRLVQSVWWMIWFSPLGCIFISTFYHIKIILTKLGTQ